MRTSIFCLLALILFILCKDGVGPGPVVETCPPIDDPNATRGIQILYPKSNDTLKVNQTINIKFKIEQINGADIINDVASFVYVGNSKYSISNRGKAVISEGAVTCLEIPWTIGKEYFPADYKDGANQVALKLCKYGQESMYYHMTEPFVIIK